MAVTVTTADDATLTTDELFESAVAVVRNLPKEGPFKPTDDLKLKFYAFYKQATHGTNDTPKPRFYQIVDWYKWDAWHKLGDMSRDEAKANYIRELKQCMEAFPTSEDEDAKYFEEVLGKRFYDYWFNQRYAERKQSAAIDTGKTETSKCNDNQSNSSTGSSVSMLEETLTTDGYKTPTTHEDRTPTIAAEMSDQFALAILRLQHGMEDSINRLGGVEDEQKKHRRRLDKLEADIKTIQSHHSASIPHRSSHRQSLTFSNSLKAILRVLKNADWCVVIWPILVFLIGRSLERRRHSNSRLLV